MGKGDITKGKILETASDLFYLYGYRGTSVDDILKASRVKKGNFYFHFKSKEALGAAVLDIYAARTTSLLCGALNKKGNPVEAVYRLFLNQEKRLKSAGYCGGCPFGNLALELADHYPAFRKKIDKIFDTWADEINEMLHRAKKEKYLDASIDTRKLSHFIIALLEGVTLLAKTKKTGRIYSCCITSLKTLLKNSEPGSAQKRHFYNRRTHHELSKMP